jgi:hypothetical protein
MHRILLASAASIVFKTLPLPFALITGTLLKKFLKNVKPAFESSIITKSKL